MTSLYDKAEIALRNDLYTNSAHAWCLGFLQAGKEVRALIEDTTTFEGYSDLLSAILELFPEEIPNDN